MNMITTTTIPTCTLLNLFRLILLLVEVPMLTQAIFSLMIVVPVAVLHVHILRMHESSFALQRKLQMDLHFSPHCTTDEIRLLAIGTVTYVCQTYVCTHVHG